MQNGGNFSITENLDIRAWLFSSERKETLSKTEFEELLWYTGGQTRCLDVPFCFHSL